MPIEFIHRPNKSITLYENSESVEALLHATIGDIIYYPDGSTKELKSLDDVSGWLKEWYFGDRLWKYDGVRNWTREVKSNLEPKIDFIPK